MLCVLFRCQVNHPIVIGHPHCLHVTVSEITASQLPPETSLPGLFRCRTQGCDSGCLGMLEETGRSLLKHRGIPCLEEGFKQTLPLMEDGGKIPPWQNFKVGIQGWGSF